MILGPISLKMLIYDWYDGPVGGVVTLVDDESYCFYLLDWDSAHRIRIFGLQKLSVKLTSMISQLTEEIPKWPVWFPSELIQPTKQSLGWTKSVKALRRWPDSIESVLVWDSVNEKAISVQLLPSDAHVDATPWFDAIESPKGQFDWFSYLSISRENNRDILNFPSQ